jgi:putative nucleotidyltransferase with HDIG domain
MENHTKKIKYFSLSNKPFKSGDKLPFSIYVVEGKKARLFYKLKETFSAQNQQDLKKYEKVYINFEDLNSYKKYYFQKKASQTKIKKEVNLETITSALKSYIRHIFSHSVDMATIKKIYPWIAHLTTNILQENQNVKDLLHLISKDYETYTHSMNVAIYAALLGREINMVKTDLNKLVLSAMLHDIGKTKIDEKILYKTEPLTPHESKLIKMHATMGYSIVRATGVADKKILSGIHHHHERLDGSGYPNGFKNEHISQFARIIGICDTYAAMSSNRTYKESKKPFEILTEMKKELKDQLDGELINHFIKALT